jgi:cobalt/nickel transport system permease protein
MHIPDGYLSPLTCATLYAGAAPFWAIALRRVKRALHTRLVPLLSLFSAFCFVVMMFNLPLPGGTTAHALGVGVSAIVLGPWASVLAVSTALLIQAVFFGDGGITALGANCFNMAIVGSLVAYGAYRALAGRAPLLAARRVIAAGVAGYVAINAAALCAAIEFGVQPYFFHDAGGAPLYAPYPLRIAVPAMMIGHLTFAGMAELILSSGIVRWLQHSNPALLLATAPGARTAEMPEPYPAPEPARLEPPPSPPATRSLWLGLAALLLLTPLGIRAVGAAWGEWSARDLASPQARRQIAAASGHQLPPARVPGGLQRLSSLWTAPFPGYAPPIVRSQSFGYLLSALFGAGLIVLAGAIVGRLAASTRRKLRSINSVADGQFQ